MHEGTERADFFFKLLAFIFLTYVMIQFKLLLENVIARFSLGLFVSIIIFTSYLNTHNIRFHTINTEINRKLSKSSISILQETKTVLMTSRSFWGFRFQEGRVGFINAGCEVNNCLLTKNHTYLPAYAFDAFLVHMPTQRNGTWILPNRRKDQLFIFFSTEPPGMKKS